MSAPGSNKEALAALIADPWYDDDYASPSGALPVPSKSLHGPFRLDSISVESFEKVSVRACREAIRKWSSLLGPLPEEFTARCEDAVDRHLSGASAVYRLVELGASARHPWGSHLGSLGFHEFVVISARAKTLALLVASDD